MEPGWLCTDREVGSHILKKSNTKNRFECCKMTVSFQVSRADKSMAVTATGVMCEDIIRLLAACGSYVCLLGFHPTNYTVGMLGGNLSLSCQTWRLVILDILAMNGTTIWNWIMCVTCQFRMPINALLGHIYNESNIILVNTSPEHVYRDETVTVYLGNWPVYRKAIQWIRSCLCSSSIRPRQPRNRGCQDETIVSGLTG